MELIRPETFLVLDFFKRKALAKMGIGELFSDLDQFEVEYLSCCANKFNELTQKELEKGSKRKR